MITFSCTKDVDIDASEESITSNLSSAVQNDEMRFIIDGNQVEFEEVNSLVTSEVFDEYRLLVHEDSNGLIKCLYFSDINDYLLYGDENNITLRKDYEFEEHMKNYAITSGAIDEYERTGEVPQSYLDYEVAFAEEHYYNESTSRSPVPWIINDFCSGPGNASMLLPGIAPVMPPFWNNRMSEYFAMDALATFHLYDRTFYRRHLASVYLEIGFQDRCLATIPGLAAADNKTSSSIHN